MSGTELRQQHIDKIYQVLSRQTPFSSLALVLDALEETVPNQPSDPNKIAFGLDANVILHMQLHSLIPDYLGGIHSGLVILPSQAVQEFWNNRQTMQGAAHEVRTRFDTLKLAVAKLDIEHQQFLDGFEALLAEFEAGSGWTWAESFRTKVTAAFKQVSARAIEPQFPKDVMAQISHERDASKTPPGFKDKDKNGDLYVWAEFLLGLLQGRAAGHDFELAVLLTRDKKADWGKGGHAHPFLCAELQEVVGVAFETWDMKEMLEHAKKVTSRKTPPSPIASTDSEVHEVVTAAESSEEAVAPDDVDAAAETPNAGPESSP